MTGDVATPGGAVAEKMREVKILMIHGYTQSGPLFRSKTRALEKLLAKSLAPANLKPVLFYPTAPNPLSAKDIPGYQPVSEDEDADPASYYSSSSSPSASPDAWAWLRKDAATGTYRLLAQGMQRIATCIRTDAGGHIDGVIGFSQGGFMAGAVAAALDAVRTPPTAEEAGWVAALRAANGGQALRFAVVYSGFYAPQPALRWLYEAPDKIRTPTLHFIGSLDTVVAECRSRGLVERCAEPAVVVHPGGHFVPVAREWVGPLVGFVQAHVGAEEAKVGADADA